MGAGWLSGSRDFLPILRSPSLVFPLPLSLSLSPRLPLSPVRSPHPRSIAVYSFFSFLATFLFLFPLQFLIPPHPLFLRDHRLVSPPLPPPPPLLLSDSACDISSLLLFSVKSPSFRRLLPISILVDFFFFFFFFFFLFFPTGSRSIPPRCLPSSPLVLSPSLRRSIQATDGWLPPRTCRRIKQAGGDAPAVSSIRNLRNPSSIPVIRPPCPI